MKRFLILGIFFSFFSAIGYNQKAEISLKEYFADAEFFFASEEYSDALQEYLEVYKRGYEGNANINYKIGICYLNIPAQKEKSIEYLVAASEKVSSKYRGSTLSETTAPIDAFLFLGNAYRVNNKLGKAIESYNHYLSILPELAVEEKGYALKQIEACNIAQEFFNDSAKVTFKNLGQIINTSSSNHNCVVSADGSTMVFMTKLPFYDAVFMSKKRGSNWSRPVNITPQIMSDGDQFVTGISHSGSCILLARQDAFDSDIYISYYENGEWTKSKPLGKPFSSRYFESHASFGKDENTIFFTSNRPGGIGGMDIYYSVRKPDGAWGEPVNIGADINTPLNEDTPFLSDQGNRLYFSSQGHMNMGGYDFFAAHLTDSGWTNPENLRYPLSTTDDDLFHFPWKEGEAAYVQKIFDDGLGSWDIYMVEPAIEAPVAEPVAEVIKEAVQETQDKKAETIEFESKPVLFGFDAYTLTAEAKAEINRYIALLKKHPALSITVKGYTDALGPEHYNMLLSERRAATVVKYMTEQGLAPEKLKIMGMGESNFIAANTKPDGSDNPEGRKLNRRVELEISGIDPSKIIIRRIDIVPREFKIPEK
ncbi:MAG: OmpA family protein [Bacteroidales bacterium]|nr:OmpA family protein [Bacteroidales bacterium]